MLLPLILATLQVTATSTANDVLDRFERFHASAKTLEARFEWSAPKIFGVGDGKLAIRRPGSCFYTVKFPSVEYRYYLNPKGGLEVAVDTKEYDEFPHPGSILLPNSRVSDVPYFDFPLAMMLGSIRRSLPETTVYELHAPQQVGGVTCDVLAGQRSRFYIGPDGRLMRYVGLARRGSSAVESIVTLSGYRVNQPLPNSTFVGRIPAGFSPMSVSPASRPLLPGSPLPEGRWHAKGGRMMSLREMLGGRPALFAIVDLDWLSANRKSVDRISRAVEGAGARLALLSDTAGKPSASGIFHDPDGRSLDRFAIAGSPTFILSSAQGTVTRSWLGFSEEDLNRMEAEFLDALRGLTP